MSMSKIRTKFDDVFDKIKQYQFLFSELVKRDFKKKYKQTALGMLWSMIAPMLELLVMTLVFKQFFGHNTPHYTTYVFSGNIIFGYYRTATSQGMHSLRSNSGIISKVNVPKYLFLLSRNVAAFINFLLTLIVFFVFAAFDGVQFHVRFFMIIYPVLTLLVFNIGVGLILSAFYIMFKDLEYLYNIFLTLLMYLSAIFYTVDAYPEKIQTLFYANPVYAHIRYIRIIVLEGRIPHLYSHILLGVYALVALVIGGIIYKRNNYKFLYYM